MREMIERVATALCISDNCDPDHVCDDPSGEVLLWSLYEKDAEAAIEAMWEPTKEMYGADLQESGAASIWNAMIEAALK